MGSWLPLAARCNNNCSQHGWCTDRERCHCFPGYQVRAPIRSVRLPKPQRFPSQVCHSFTHPIIPVGRVKPRTPSHIQSSLSTLSRITYFISSLDHYCKTLKVRFIGGAGFFWATIISQWQISLGHTQSSLSTLSSLSLLHTPNHSCRPSQPSHFFTHPIIPADPLKENQFCFIF